MKKHRLRICLLLVLAANGMQAQVTVKNSPVPVDSGYMQVDGGELYYEVAGQGENIVLLHDGMVP
jgi:hypothetical protein